MSSIEERYLTGELTDDCQLLRLDNHKALYPILRKMHGKKLSITVDILRYQRSDAQNRYMWGVVVPVVRAFTFEMTGEKYDKDVIYAFIRSKVMGEQPKITEVDLGDGKLEEVITMTGKRFSQMTTKEFAEAVEKIINYFDDPEENGYGSRCVIPLPRRGNHINDYINEKKYRGGNDDDEGDRN